MADGRGGFTHLGCGVWERASAGGPETAKIDGRSHVRFMDRLYLPGMPADLRPEAIIAINRWRECVLAREDLPHRTRVRRVLTAVCATVGRGQLAEIGPGKFPLISPERLHRYTGYDIDEEAAVWNSATGAPTVCDPNKFAPLVHGSDTAVGLFVMQFGVDRQVIDALWNEGAPDLIFACNLPTKDQALRQHLLEDIQSRELRLEIIELEAAGVHDTILLMARPEAAERLSQAFRAVREQCKLEWPSLFQTSSGWS